MCGAVSFTLSVLRDLSLKRQANQRMLTFKDKVKVKLESFSSCLQLQPSSFYFIFFNFFFFLFFLSFCFIDM